MQESQTIYIILSKTIKMRNTNIADFFQTRINRLSSPPTAGSNKKRLSQGVLGKGQAIKGTYSARTCVLCDSYYMTRTYVCQEESNIYSENMFV